MGLVHLKGLTELEVILLDYTQITNAGLEHLKGRTNLTWLNLVETQITDAGLEHLKGMTNLNVLMHCVARDDGYEFRTVECSFESPADRSPPSLCDLTAASSSNLFLPLNSSRD